MRVPPVSKAIVIFLGILPLCVSDASSDGDVCAREASGGTVTAPAELRSSNGQLRVALAFRSDLDESGLTRYCYISGNAIESPTLRVNTGDEVVLELKTAVATNLHFHGLELPPLLHQDD